MLTYLFKMSKYRTMNQGAPQANANANAQPQQAGGGAAGAAAGGQGPPAVQPPAQPQWQANAAQLGLNVEQTELMRILCGHHSFTRDQYVTLSNEGYATKEDLIAWKHKEIRSLLTNLSGRPANRGGRQYGDRRIKQLQALTWFLTDRHSRGLDLDTTDYEANSNDYILCAEVDAEEMERDSSKAEKPNEFKYKEWIKWEESVYLYFDSILGSNNVPLSYVIRKDLPPGTVWDQLENKVQKIHNAPLQGFVFNIDTKKVMTVIKETCLGTEAEPWIKNIKCGREAMRALQLHYDGNDEAKKRLTDAKARLKTIFYKHEATFSFEKFATQLHDIFQTCERYGEPLFENQKLEHLLDKCHNNHPEFRQEVVICRSKDTDFMGAITYLKTVVARLFPEGLSRGKGKRTISAYGADKQTMINGVDVSDYSRWYTKAEIGKLNKTKEGKAVWKKILNNKGHKSSNTDKYQQKKKAKIARVQSRNGGSNGNDDDQTTGNETSQTALTTNEQRMVAAMINGVANASRQNQGIQFPINGRSHQVSSANSRRSPTNTPNNGSRNQDEVSVVTFDHLGNPL